LDWSLLAHSQIGCCRAQLRGSRAIPTGKAKGGCFSMYNVITTDAHLPVISSKCVPYYGVPRNKSKGTEKCDFWLFGKRVMISRREPNCFGMFF